MTIRAAGTGRITMRFEWDAEKAAENLKKLGVSFEEAVTAFYDPWRQPLTTRTIPSENTGF
jgi:uncharacterized DUF497 family protein